MKFSYEIWSIKELVEIITSNQVDLKPSYQRNFIWGKKDQSSLIDSILSGYPIPTFFLYKKDDNRYEMVDGQQRSKTILLFFLGEITNSIGQSFESIDKDKFLNYPLNITIMSNVSGEDSLEGFYTLVNKSGKHLNPNELNKAQYHDSVFLELVERIVDSKEIKELDLFTDASKKRMNDRALIEEVVATIPFGIFEKRKAVNELFEGLDSQKAQELFKLVMEILERIIRANEIMPLKKTRYRQRNDFLTLFHFVSDNLAEDLEIFLYQYRILLLLQPYIKPSQEECEPIKNYALNCVSQSNSKSAREGRLHFFNAMLKNSVKEGTDELQEVLEFLENKFSLEETELKEIGNYYLIDLDKFPNE